MLPFNRVLFNCTIKISTNSFLQLLPGWVVDERHFGANIPPTPAPTIPELRPVPSYYVSRAVVSEPSRTQAQALANAWHLASCMRNHSQRSKPVNSTPTVDETPEPAVYIRTIAPCHIDPIWLKCCAYWLLLSNILMLQTLVV